MANALPHIEQPSTLDPGVLACAATGISQLIDDRGGDIDRIFGRAGIDQKLIEDPTTDLRLLDYCNLFEQASRQTGDDNFGLWFGQQYHPGQLGILGYVSLNASTVGAALTNLIRYFPIHQQGTIMRLAEDDGYLKLEYKITDEDIPAKRQDAELSLGMFYNIFRHCYGRRWASTQVHFEHAKPCDWREHESAFDAPVLFNQPTNAIVFKRADLSGSMPHPDARLLAVLEGLLARVNVPVTARDDFLGSVRYLIQVSFATGYPKMEIIARKLRLSPSMLQRRLNGHNVSYQELVEKIRCTLAKRYVANGQTPLTEVALILGYSELSAFSRAFRRWTGMSPTRYANAMSPGHAQQG
ncbi:MAG: AraC family transcriptional regulator [Gammaproteobacteria bacterium]|nr:AraC family transcriptional regulator [Gammaproteobacteria bacterium]